MNKLKTQFLTSLFKRVLILRLKNWELDNSRVGEKVVIKIEIKMKKTNKFKNGCSILLCYKSIISVSRELN